MSKQPNCICGHPDHEHGQERELGIGTDSRREVCLRCPGYDEPGYPTGKAWHRYLPHLPPIPEAGDE